MSTLLSEDILELSEAATFIKGQFRGRKPSVSTVLRWCLYGLRGIKLESLKCGGQRMTTKQAVIRFIDRLSNPSPSPRPPADESRLAAAEAELVARGVM